MFLSFSILGLMSVVWVVYTHSKHRQAVTDCQHSFRNQRCKGRTLLCAAISSPHRPPEPPGDLRWGALCSGKPQPFHKLLNFTGDPRQCIPSRQISFAHQQLSEQLLGWNPTQLFQKMYQQTKQNAISNCLYFQVTLYGLCTKTWIFNSLLPTTLPFSAHIIPISCHICLFSMSLWLFTLWLMLLTSISLNLILLFLH